MNIRQGVCQGVPVPIPLGYLNEVDHVSFALEIDERQRGHGANSNLTSSSSPSIHPSANIHPTSSAVASTAPTIPSPTPSPSSVSVAGFWRRKESRPNIEICTVRLFEKPGCYEPVLIRREFAVGSGTGGESECVKRSPGYMPLSEVYVRIDCSDGSGSGSEYSHAPAIGNGTVPANATVKGHVSHPPNGVMPGRWQQRRLSLLGR